MARQEISSGLLAGAVRKISTLRRYRDRHAAIELREFIALLQAPDVREHASELLTDLLREADRLHLDRAGLAKGCHVSVPSISRWTNNKVQPHIEIARAAIRVLVTLAEERLATLAREPVAKRKTS